MGRKIERLSEEVMNQIAAGEVVESPASVVKELIENSLDAGASSIQIRIEEGGFSLIEVEDDGCGMGPEDAKLCLERHATSKIRLVSDLDHLATMGFRGEALSAISSISLFELSSSENELGVFLRSEGGRIVEEKLLARNRGTTMRISSLFFNTPARKKFQKSPRACRMQIEKTVETIALAHPEVRFCLQSDGDLLFDLFPSSLQERVFSRLSPFPLVVEEKGMIAFLSAPQEAKRDRRGQFLFINRRPLFSPLLSKAVQRGYGTRLLEHSYPPFVLFLQLDPKEIDVNVHPQKKEVRFEKESNLFLQVEQGVSRAFLPQGQEKIFSFTPPREDSFLPSFPLPSFSLQEESLELPWEREVRPLALFDKFFLIDQEGLIWVDLSKATARLAFDSIRGEKKQIEPLLIPFSWQMEEEEMEALEQIGIGCRSMGARQVLIEALPLGMDQGSFPRFFSAWQEGKNLERALVEWSSFSLKHYNFDEGLSIWNQLQKCRDSLYDPLGRVIWKKISAKELETWMQRG